MNKIFLCFIFVLSSPVFSGDIPERPQAPDHISSNHYTYQSEHIEFKIKRRKIDLYLPKSDSSSDLFPVIVFGHGQALKANAYHELFVHLAKKGIAVIHPMYDSGFFDQNWQRMGEFYNSLTKEVLNRYPQLDQKDVVYSGHSKGGYIALIAASLSTDIRPKLVSVFSPAVFEQEIVEALPNDAKLRVIWGEADGIIKQEVAQNIYDYAPTIDKELFIVESFTNLKANHFFPLTKKTMFGGNDGLNAHHYYSVFPMLIN